MDLINNGLSPVRLFNYGSPRIGNEEFATFSSNSIGDRNRVTHHKDMVVHCPTSLRLTHISGEWYQPDDNIVLNECFGFEDPKCSYQWSITSIDDHLHYLGVTMGGDGCSSIL